MEAPRLGGFSLAALVRAFAVVTFFARLAQAQTPLQVPLAQAQEVPSQTYTSPECFQNGHAYGPDMWNATETLETSAIMCQQKCLGTPGCEFFGWSPEHHNCHYGFANAVLVSQPDSIAGPKVCPVVPVSQMEAHGIAHRCTVEMPGATWPAHTTEGSNSAWTSRAQPKSLECWPKDPATGDYTHCGNVPVLEDTASGWPGKCQDLKLVEGVTTEHQCKQSCIENPECAVWQLAPAQPTHSPPLLTPTCWQGVGSFCYVGMGFGVVRSQRLEHGQVRVLKDLTGWQIYGLTQHFRALASPDNGYFVDDATAAHFCKLSCYSDIKCQYWTYVKSGGCWLEDTTKGSVKYPLTLDEATRDTDIAKDTIAGEYIQHYCPPDVVGKLPQKPEAPVCSLANTRYAPILTSPSEGGGASNEGSAFACQQRCVHVGEHCAFWSWKAADGSCTIAGPTAVAVVDSTQQGGAKACQVAHEQMVLKKETASTHPVEAGATEIHIEDQAGVHIGDAIVIGDETGIVQAFGSVILGQPLKKSWPAGTSIQVYQAAAPTAQPAAGGAITFHTEAAGSQSNDLQVVSMGVGEKQPSVKISMRFPNITYALIQPDELEKLKLEYAIALSTCLKCTKQELHDLNGNKGTVTLSEGSLKIECLYNMEEHGYRQTIGVVQSEILTAAFKQAIEQATFGVLLIDINGVYHDHPAVLGVRADGYTGVVDRQVVYHAYVESPEEAASWFRTYWWLVIIIVVVVVLVIGGIVALVLGQRKGRDRKKNKEATRALEMHQEMVPALRSGMAFESDNEDRPTGKEDFVPFKDHHFQDGKTKIARNRMHSQYEKDSYTGLRGNSPEIPTVQQSNFSPPGGQGSVRPMTNNRPP